MSNTKLYNGDDIIKDVYYGNNIISKIYKGNEEIYNVYYDGEIIFESPNEGTYNIELKVKGVYEITIVGASGGGNGSGETSGTNSEFAAAGAGGAGFSGEVYSNGRGSCSITIGNAVSGHTKGGDSSIVLPNGDTIVAGGGEGSLASGNSSVQTVIAGNGGVLNPFPSSIIVSTVASGNGEDGQANFRIGSGSVSAGPCKSPLYDYGITTNGTFDRREQGTTNSYTAWTGTSGYVKIVYKRHDR